MRSTFLIAAGATLALCGAAAAQSFTGLGNLGGATPTSTGRAVTNGGSVVVGDSAAPGAVEAFRWTPGGMQSLGTLPGRELSSLALGVNASGAVVVGHSRGDGFVLEAFRWTQGAGMEGLGFLPGHGVSVGAAVSGDGATIVGPSAAAGLTGAQAFRWREASGMEGLGFLPGDIVSEARGASGDGSIIVGTSGLGFSPTSARQACLWEDGVARGLGFLPGDTGSVAQAVSADGATVIGGSFVVGGIGSHPFRWSEAGGMEYLGLGPQSSNCDALSVSADGSIIVGTCYTASRNIACIWTAAEGIRPLEEVLADEYGLSLPGWLLIIAHGVSPAGDAIVGYAINPRGEQEAFLAVLSPACVADCDGDGALTFFDFLCFQNLFAAGDPGADCDGDGELTFFDFLCFQNAFAAGCP